MEERDPIDDYADMLEAENRENDELLTSRHYTFPENLPAFLEHAARRFEASRQRYEADLAMQERQARSSPSSG